MDTVNDTVIITLNISLIHKIFKYSGENFKLLIHREDSTDEQRSKVLSIEVIMRSGLEDYFEDVLLCDRLREKLCYEAARRGYVNTLIWAREHGCEWNSDTCMIAAEGGHLDCLIWAREHGCNWNRDTCRSAALGGHLDCLIWAREHGCDWNKDASIDYALKVYRLDCSKLTLL